jgi:hypothetical protein
MDKEQGGPVSPRTASKPHISVYADRSAKRRIELHHRLVRRRRWSRELDAICRGDRWNR